jgi:hypothetical protein
MDTDLFLFMCRAMSSGVEKAVSASLWAAMALRSLLMYALRNWYDGRLRFSVGKSNYESGGL